jgi:LysM repeat protein
VRFYNPVAQELGRRAEAFMHLLQRDKAVEPHVGQAYVMHRAHNGDTLAILAKHYGTTVEAIRSANGLKGIDIKMGHTYRIPVPKPVAPQKGAPQQKRAATPAPAAHRLPGPRAAAPRPASPPPRTGTGPRH